MFYPIQKKKYRPRPKVGPEKEKKTVPEVSSMALCRHPRAVLETQGTVFFSFSGPTLGLGR